MRSTLPAITQPITTELSAPHCNIRLSRHECREAGGEVTIGLRSSEVVVINNVASFLKVEELPRSE